MAYPLRFLDVMLTPISMPMRGVTLAIHKKLGKQKSNLSIDQLSQALELTSEADTTKEEQKILTELKQNDKIVIIQADKGGKIVVCHPGITEVAKSNDTMVCTESTSGVAKPAKINDNDSQRCQCFAEPVQPKEAITVQLVQQLPVLSLISVPCAPKTPPRKTVARYTLSFVLLDTRIAKNVENLCLLKACR